MIGVPSEAVLWREKQRKGNKHPRLLGSRSIIAGACDADKKLPPPFMNLKYSDSWISKNTTQSYFPFKKKDLRKERKNEKKTQVYRSPQEDDDIGFVCGGFFVSCFIFFHDTV